MPTPTPWFALPQLKHLKPDEPGAKSQVVIIGSGLAGCHTAYELAQRGIKVVLVDASDTIAGGASGSNAGIVKPFVTRFPSLADKFYKAAFAFILDRLDADKTLRTAVQFNPCGVLQLIEREYPESDAYINCTADQASVLAGVEINALAIQFKRGGWLNTAMLCNAMAQHHNIDVQLNMSVEKITRMDSGWSLSTCTPPQLTNTPRATPNATINCQTLILANGNQLHDFAQTNELPITAARGQTSRFACKNNALKIVVTGKCYAIPNGNNVTVGASFIRNNQDRQITSAEHQENLLGLKALLPSLTPHSTALSGYCGIRATTPDRFPVVGPVPEFSHYRADYALLKNGLPHHRFPNARYLPGLFVIGGFGSRGIVSAPYCAKLLAQYLCGPTLSDPEQELSESRQGLKYPTQSQFPHLSGWSALLHPGRFIVRDLKRSQHLVHSTHHD